MKLLGETRVFGTSFNFNYKKYWKHGGNMGHRAVEHA